MSKTVTSLCIVIFSSRLASVFTHITICLIHVDCITKFYYMQFSLPLALMICSIFVLSIKISFKTLVNSAFKTRPRYLIFTLWHYTLPFILTFNIYRYSTDPNVQSGRRHCWYRCSIYDQNTEGKIHLCRGIWKGRVVLQIYFGGDF